MRGKGRGAGFSDPYLLESTSADMPRSPNAAASAAHLNPEASPSQSMELPVARMLVLKQGLCFRKMDARDAKAGTPSSVRSIDNPTDAEPAERERYKSVEGQLSLN